jgi:hypothetical protein
MLLDAVKGGVQDRRNLRVRFPFGYPIEYLRFAGRESECVKRFWSPGAVALFEA